MTRYSLPTPDYALVALSLLLGGCEAGQKAPLRVSQSTSAQIITSHTDPSGLTFDVASRSPRSEACPNNRLIGRTAGAICPDPSQNASGGAWAKARLFDGGHPATLGALDSYCVYSWVPTNQGTPPDLSPGILPNDVHDKWADWLSGDCNVVAAQSNNYTDLITPHLQTAFYAQTERANTPSSGALPTPVYVVDSAVDSTIPFPANGRLEHGHAMGMIIRRLTCPDIGAAPAGAIAGGCLSAVGTKLALKLRYTTTGRLVRDNGLGGFFGSTGDLAAAIYEATRQAEGLGSSFRAVINLSVGWDPEYGGAYVANNWASLPTEIRVVQQAISYARCHGAIILAAAGNDTGGPTASSGAMYPANWTNKPIPTAGECLALGVTGPPSAITSYEPLVYAVSGVDGADKTLANARTGARAALVAPAAHAALTVAGTTDPLTPAYTGSSIATAVTSAAAASAWTQQPGLSGSDAMQMVYDAAVDLGSTADFCLGAICPNQSRVSICRTLALACTGASCSSPSCPTPTAFRDERFTPLLPPVGLLSSVISVIDHTKTWTVGAPCNATVLSSTTAPNAPCPGSQLYSYEAEPWVEPQQEVIPCPTCGIIGDTLVMGLNDPLDVTLTDPNIMYIDLAGQKNYIALEIDVSELTAGATLKIVELPVPSSDMTEASIQFMVDNEYSSSSPLMLEN